jgi:FkbM family methyltransferase
MAPGAVAVAAQPDAAAQFATLRHEKTEIQYATPNYATRWRFDTFFDKEPDTLEWIAGFKPGDVMVDIGANVGMYSIWAAMTRNVRVYAFEPESQNYALLYQNIVHNDLAGRVTGYCAALSDTSGYSSLYLSEFVAGSSVHTYGAALDFKLAPRTSKVVQGCFATTLDELVATAAVPLPTHIKIDVDGLEHKVLAGCRQVLAEPALKSIRGTSRSDFAAGGRRIRIFKRAGEPLYANNRQLQRRREPCLLPLRNTSCTKWRMRQCANTRTRTSTLRTFSLSIFMTSCAPTGPTSPRSSASAIPGA